MGLFTTKYNNSVSFDRKVKVRYVGVGVCWQLWDYQNMNVNGSGFI